MTSTKPNHLPKAHPYTGLRYVNLGRSEGTRQSTAAGDGGRGREEGPAHRQRTERLLDPDQQLPCPREAGEIRADGSKTHAVRRAGGAHANVLGEMDKHVGVS